MHARLQSLVLCVVLGATLVAQASIAAEPAGTADKAAPEPSLIKIGPTGEIETPQVKVDSKGVVEVPGLGGMKFMPNGDIFSSDGKKLYDGAAGGWDQGAAPKKSVVPLVRIGDTPAQCAARYVEVKKISGLTFYQDGDWLISVGFYRGRADHVACSRVNGKNADLKKEGLVLIELMPGQQEIEALQKLNGGERVWEKTGSSTTKYSRTTGGNEVVVMLPDVRWQTKDGLLHFRYRANVSDETLRESFTVTTGGYQEREERKSDRTKMNRDDARAAWELGVSITTLASGDLKGLKDGLRELSKGFTSLRAAQPARAVDPTLALWEVPTPSGDAKKDRQALSRVLTKLSERIVKALGADEVTAGEPGVAGCFELGRHTPLVILVLRANDPKLKADFLDEFAAAGRNSNLPKGLWEPVLEKARSGAANEEITAASVKMFNDVTKYLAAKQAEWKPPAPATEK